MEPRGTEAYLKQYVEVTRASLPAEGLSQQRIRDCSTNVHK